VSPDRENPRQIGLVFGLAPECETLTWERQGQWDNYPADDIGRLSGTVKASEGFAATALGPMTFPEHPWRLDNLPHGNNDFCSTKHNVITASLADAKGNGLRVYGQAKQHVRCWKLEKQSCILVADYSNGGLGAYLHRLITYDRRPLKVGDKISGTVEISPADCR